MEQHDTSLRDPIESLVRTVIIALARIGPEYFRLVTTYSPAGIVRERIFCYELYHQLRLAMPPELGLLLHGEIDKSGHEDFDRHDRSNPDFVLHVPGQHTGNTLVIEVKGSLSDRSGVLKDFSTLLTFTERYHYRAGIFILYNNSFADLQMVLGNRGSQLRAAATSQSIHILTTSGPGHDWEQHLLAEI